MPPAIVVENLGKRYRISHDGRPHARYKTLRDAVTNMAAAPLRRWRNGGESGRREDFWALKEISFDVQPGEVIGIIGRNGAGKSTLLKILSRITKPTTGQVTLHGRVGSLLEVGTGFHAELTGRENIFLNGSILGMSRKEIQKQFDAIIDFSGVEKFLDTPVKRYSSGMYVRLAFAVAAHLNPEILIVDEVLAVGDFEFQQKCLGKMRDVASGGRTVLFVSHNMQAINLLCSRGLLLRDGREACIGTAREAIENYNRGFAVSPEHESDPQRRPGSGEYRFAWVRPVRPVFQPGDMIQIEFLIGKYSGSVGRMFFSAHVLDHLGVIVAHCDSRLVGAWIEDKPEAYGTFELKTPWLKPGVYRLDFHIIAADGFIDRFESACRLSISSQWPYPHAAPPESVGKGTVLADFDWRLSTAASSHPPIRTANA
jgi:homopolymeric O-antigen transport system ATP-binding protein